MRMYFPLQIAMTGLIVLHTSTAAGQRYPEKPLRIVTSGIGGAADASLRIFTPGLAENLKQRIIIDNRATGVIPGEIVSKATPDGYTLLSHATLLWVGPLIQAPPYNVLRDFAPITLLTSAPNLIVVNPAVPVQTVKDLIAYAKSRPGELNYASGATGAPNHLAAEMFNVMAGVKLVRITYKSGATQMADLVGGQVQIMFANAGTVIPFVKSNRLRALAVTSAKPSPLAPGLPTVAAAGLPGFEAETRVGIFAPAKTPTAIVNLLNRESVRYLQSADARERYLNVGLEPVISTPEEFTSGIKSDITKWKKVIDDAGIRGD
jgi:tripartite-type tricarboxylate transporter receptor subunit TctC